MAGTKSAPAATNGKPTPPQQRAGRMDAGSNRATRTARLAAAVKQRPFGSVAIATPPTSIGTTISSVTPSTIRTQDGLVIVGREFLCQVQQINTPSSWYCGAICPLHPAYYPAGVMGNTCRAYQQYRFRKVIVHFVTKLPTTTNGEVAMAYSKNILLAANNGNSASFIPRVMTQGKAVLGPLWTNHSMVVPVDSVWRQVDAFSATNIAANINGEILVYSLAATTEVSGYLLIDYELEFKDTMFSPHSSQLPISLGPGVKGDIVIPSTTALDGVRGANATLSAFANGTVYKIVVDIDATTWGSGTTASNAWTVGVAYNTSTTPGSTIATSNFSVNDGSVWYLAVVGGNLWLYSSYEAACNGNTSGQVFQRTTSTSDTSVSVIYYLVRYGVAQIGNSS
nr:structural protein [Tolivirales sp.]